MQKHFHAGLVHFYIGMLYAVTPKMSDQMIGPNVLSYTSVNFNDCLNGGQLHYDWDKITVTRLNHILTSATAPSSVGLPVTLRPWLPYLQCMPSCYSGSVHNHWPSLWKSQLVTLLSQQNSCFSWCLYQRVNLPGYFGVEQRARG